MKKWLRNVLLVCALGAGALLGCPLFELTGIPCPLCGTTRAWLSLLGGDLAEAFRCNPLFLLTPVWFLGVLLLDGPLKEKKWARWLAVAFAVCLFAMNCLRWAGLIPMAGWQL